MDGNGKTMARVNSWRKIFWKLYRVLAWFCKISWIFGIVGLRAEKSSEVNKAIKEMIKIKKPVLLDMVVDQHENCFPMIPSGAAHNEILLGPDDQTDETVNEEGMVLV